jgi:hypothetical protein
LIKERNRPIYQKSEQASSEINRYKMANLGESSYSKVQTHPLTHNQKKQYPATAIKIDN